MKNIKLLIFLFLLSYTTQAQVVFYSDLESWNDKANGWGGLRTNVPGNKIIHQTTGAYDGNSACKLINESASSHKRFSTKLLQLDSGDVFNIHFYVKGKGKIRTGLFDGRSSSFGYATYNAYDSINNVNWMSVSQNVECKHTHDSAEFIISILKTDSLLGDLTIDSVTITNVATTQIVFASSFESWNEVPFLWMGSKSSIDIDSISKITAGAYEGTKACQLRNTSNIHKRFSTFRLSVDSGDVYNVRFYVEGAGHIRTGLFDNRNNAFGYSYGDFDTISTFSWTLFSQDLICKKTTDSAEFIISVKETSLYHLIIDSVTITKVSTLVTGENQINVESSLNVFPNPANDYIQLNTSLKENSTLKVYSLNGQLLQTELISNKQKINISSLSSGMYLLELSDSNGTLQKQILVKD